MVWHLEKDRAPRPPTHPLTKGQAFPKSPPAKRLVGGHLSLSEEPRDLRVQLAVPQVAAVGNVPSWPPPPQGDAPHVGRECGGPPEGQAGLLPTQKPGFLAIPVPLSLRAGTPTHALGQVGVWVLGECKAG